MSTVEIVMLVVGSAGLFFALFCHLKSEKSFLTIPGHDRALSIKLFCKTIDEAESKEAKAKIADQQSKYIFWWAMKWRFLFPSVVIMFIWWFSWKA